MPRIVSVWLPRWPILRFLAAQTRSLRHRRAIDPRQPFILAVEASGGAAHRGLEQRPLRALGWPWATRWPTPAPRPEKAAGASCRSCSGPAALRRLALWATRYTPAVSPWGEANGADGFFLDVTGAAHLFGGEEGLLADLAQRLNHFGLPARLAVADTAGAAWALSRFHPSASRCAAVRAGGRGARSLAGRGAAAVARYAHDAAAARLQARRRADRTSRARRLLRAFRPSCCCVSTRRSAVHPSRWHSSFRRRSTTACASCSSRSSTQEAIVDGRAAT